MILEIILLVVGFVVLILGADRLVSGASALARKHRISELAIGLTIVAFGTSAPELVVNLVASVEGHADIALGNVMGSNLFNLLFILGISGLIIPLAVQSSTVKKEIPMALLSGGLLFLLANDVLWSDGNALSRLDGIILLAGFAYFLYYVIRMQPALQPEQAVEQPIYPVWKMWVYMILGLGGLVLGGNLIVNNAVLIAQAFGMSEKIIALTIVAVGTSLPELATSIVAALKKNTDIAVGNIIGSNIFNILLILGLSSVIRPLAYNTQYNIDIYIMSAGTIVLLLAMFTSKRKVLDRWEAAVLLAGYLAYMVYLLT